MAIGARLTMTVITGVTRRSCRTLLRQPPMGDPRPQPDPAGEIAWCTTQTEDPGVWI